MRITFSPIAVPEGGQETIGSVSVDVITVDGVAYDLSGEPEGGYAEPEGEHPFAGRIARVDGELRVPLQWRYSRATAERAQPRENPVVVVADGPIPDPILRKAEEDA
ncbi:hypothetical protein [Leisingera sp. ANG-Vp]|uniref:hypothetical protein n=1 Tax=Leisingera sp. ANG-Vp TaxID=1577896 RepID=UPI00057E79FC|nr:hypothetical protein [Leisingera sp. ANG-Vp]KIC22430.1 hypothetical protein RA20_00660 [Leisingera sp. ANG-Vp]